MFLNFHNDKLEVQLKASKHRF